MALLVSGLTVACDRVPVGEPIAAANSAPAVATTIQPPVPGEPDPGEVPDGGRSEGNPCGPAECPEGWQCCDEACGICVRPGEGCMARACADPL